MENNTINFVQEYRFEDCRYKLPLRFDFYIPEHNLCIEYDGIQHFKSFEFFGGEDKLKITQMRDEIKNDYCKKNGINLIRISYNELVGDAENILDDEFKRLRELNNELKEVC